MPDFNQILTPGDYQNGAVNAVVEIPEGSTLKIEWDRETGLFKLDRVEPGIFAKPCSYGFIPQTLDDDGDELDVLIVTDAPLPMGVVVEAKILGVMNFEDDGDIDHKVVIRAADDRNDGDWLNSLEDLGERWKEMVAHHFTHYKDLKKPGSTRVLGWGDAEEAKKVVGECIERYNQK
jgi:inorganic pyrophosphatase